MSASATDNSTDQPERCLPPAAASAAAANRRGAPRSRGRGGGSVGRGRGPVAAAAASLTDSFGATSNFTRGAVAAAVDATAYGAINSGKSRRTRAVKQTHHQPAQPDFHRRQRHQVRPPTKAPPSGVARDGRHRSWLFHANSYYQLGDVVAVAEGSRVYYGQIRALFLDSELSASCQLVWLVPIDPQIDTSDKQYSIAIGESSFEPSAYTLGPVDEALYRPLDGVKFVCHCPADYFSDSAGHCKPDSAGGKGYVWTTLETEIAATARS